MGFFSSKKEQQESDLRDTHSVVQVIKSRFYGKQRPKERPPLYIPDHTTYPIPRTYPADDSTTAPPSPLQGGRRDDSPVGSPIKARQSSDVLTITLAQRLNELAAANSEGLLNDDEYFLLRQNLFERFASGAVVPAEKPVVPVARQTPGNFNRPPVALPEANSVSNFHLSPHRSVSIRSKASVSSSITSLFRRATSSNKIPSSARGSDSSSIFSTNSAVSHSFLRPSNHTRHVSRKQSNASIRTESSRANFDTASIASHRTALRIDRIGLSDRNASTISLPRSARRGQAASPPSSFPARVVGVDVRQPSSANSHGVFDADNLVTTADIRKEIESLEGESNRLLDAFNGLEISTLTRAQNRSGRRPSVHDAVDSTWTLVPNRRPLHRALDSDATSLRSNDSSGTPSVAKSIRRPHALRRHNSRADISSSYPVPPLSASSTFGQVDIDSSSSMNPLRTPAHLTLNPSVDHDKMLDMAMEDDEDALALDKEIGDIRRRREEVMSRYEVRLEYLRAKLRGAEIHERLLRK